jgi:hypothetical protein
MRLVNVLSWIIIAISCNIGGCSIEDDEVLDRYVEQVLVFDGETGRLCVMECDLELCAVTCLD